MMRYLLILVLWLQACSTKSRATPYADLTATEKARIALNEQDFGKAIELYKNIVADNPADYESRRFLAAAYAGLGGFDIVKAVEGTLESSSDGGSTSLLDTLGEFVPKEPTDEQIAALANARDTMLSLPEEYRSTEHPEIETSSSAAQQLQFYTAAYSIIYINKFAQVTAAGSLDPDKLESMSEADVDNIVDNFESLAAASGGGVVAEGAAAIIQQLDAAPGGTRKEKLMAYLEAQKH